MFSKPLRGPWRFLLLPFSLLYWLGIGIRNWLYDKRILGSSAFGLPLICVGNLAAGGTGKSPMVEYLVEKLKDRKKVATLSRGYKRKTRGYALATEDTTALEIGDEPMQFHRKFPGVPVAVGESRLEAIPQLLHDRPEIELIILDDAFQHRAVRAGLNILLTEKERLYTRDFYLPVGYLRDQKKSSRRAQVIIVTKCPTDLSTQERDEILRDLSPLPGQEVFFTTLEYGKIYHIKSGAAESLKLSHPVLLVTGIANPAPLQAFLRSKVSGLETMRFDDHHIYTIDDLRAIRRRFAEMSGEGRIVLTTEKDAVRLLKFQEELQQLPLYVLPVRHRFLFDGEQEFLRTVYQFTQTKTSDKTYGQETFKEEKA